MKLKSEVCSHFFQVKESSWKWDNQKIWCLQAEGNQEYFSTEFTAFLKEKGIRREFSCQYKSQQNNVVMQKNHTILEMAYGML